MRLANPEHPPQCDPRGARSELEGDANPHTVAAAGELEAGQHTLLKRKQPQVTFEPSVHENPDPRDSCARDEDARPETTDAGSGRL